jgi:translocation and assembly module TamA
MFRFQLRSSLAAILVAYGVPGHAQEAGEAAQEPPLAAPAFDPRAPLPPIPEIEDEWQRLYESPEAAAELDEAETPAQEFRYDVDLSALQRFPFLDEFRDLSALVAGRGETVPSLAALRRRAGEDEELLRRLLRSKGYYDPEVRLDVEPAPENGARLRVVAAVSEGPLYHLSTVSVGLPPGPPHDRVMEILALSPGAPVDAEAITAATDRLRLRLTEEGYPFAEIPDPEIVVDHETRTASYAADVRLGPLSSFGEIRVEGEKLFSAKHIGRLARFKPGDTYNSAEIEDLRRALIATGLVSTVSLEPQRTGFAGPEGKQRVDIVVRLTPAPLRTVAGQIGYSTTDGIRVEASWQHRNLIKPQGQVTFRGVAATQEQRLSADLRRSNWKKRDRTLGARIELSREDRDAFFARSFTVGAFIERETNLIWQKKWVYRLGAEFVATQERDRSQFIGTPGGLDTFLITALPSSLTYDGSNDLLDPTRGFRLTARASPELSLQSGVFGYLRAQTEGSLYLPITGDDFVLAGRVRLGTIFGADRSRIAPSRRFYAGGGGSVRGYGYQEVGQLDADGDPLGGRSINEFSLEARYRFGDFGIVPFVDAGQVYTSVYPQFTDLRFGVGIGARYYTSFGPIRLDIATPIDKRPTDPRIAVYVSIGQAF